MARGRIGACVLALLALAVSGLPTGTAAAEEPPFVLYVAPGGSGANNGLTPQTPVASLESAEYRLRQNAVTDRDVEIRIEQGTYLDDGTAWSTYVPGHTISFLPIDYHYEGVIPPGGRPVFQSPAGDGGYWFWAQLPAGHPGGDTSLRFYYLTVTGYAQGGLAVVGPNGTVSGLRRPIGAGMNGNTVYGMRFENIGSQHNPATYGFGGVTLENSSGNQIVNNHFVHLENTGTHAAGIHGVYAMHGSSGNSIRSNDFQWISGNPMRVRNDSNSNDIRDNEFTRTGQPNGGFYSDWSCDADCASQNGQARECPSHGNLFRYNTLRTSYTGGWQDGFALWPGGLDYVGGPGCSNDGQPRLTTAGNVRP